MNLYTFQSILNKNINLKTRLKSENDSNMVVHFLTKTILTATWNFSFLKPFLDHNHISLSAHIGILIIQKRRAKAIWKRTKCPSEKKTFNKLCYIYKKQLSKQRADDYSNHIALLFKKKLISQFYQSQFIDFFSKNIYIYRKKSNLILKAYFS